MGHAGQLTMGHAGQLTCATTRSSSSRGRYASSAEVFSVSSSSSYLSDDSDHSQFSGCPFNNNNNYGDRKRSIHKKRIAGKNNSSSSIMALPQAWEWRVFFLTLPHTYLGIIFLLWGWISSWNKYILNCCFNPFLSLRYRLKLIVATLELLGSELRRVQLNGKNIIAHILVCLFAVTCNPL